MALTKQVTEPENELTEEAFLNHVLHLEAKDVNVKFLFDHVRNYGIAGATLFAATKILGHASATSNPLIQFWDFLSGGILFALPWALFALNLMNGIVAVARIQKVASISKWVFVLVFVVLALAGLRLMLFAVRG